MILLIPTALYSIYVGEAFMAAAKAQEAEISAAWDITGYLLHDYINAQDYESGPNGERSLYQDVTYQAELRMRQHLDRLDSYRYDDGGSGGQRLVVSRQQLTNVSCGPMDARGEFNGALLTFEGTAFGTRQYLHRGGYVRCSARVGFDPQFIPRTLREPYSSKVDLLRGSFAAAFEICGSGNSLRGCDGDRPGVLVLTNDWGLDSARENPVGSRTNVKYFNVGESVFNAIDPADPDDIQGGVGSDQVKEALQLFLDENGQDYGDTSKFKFGFYNPMDQEYDYPSNNHDGTSTVHMNPWDDGEGPYTSTRNVYDNARHPTNYLGHETATFIDTPQ